MNPGYSYQSFAQDQPPPSYYPQPSAPFQEYTGEIMPEQIPVPPPLDERGLIQAYSRSSFMYNGIQYYWHHGSWWRLPFSHGYFTSPSFFNAYFNRWGIPYQGVTYGPHCGVPMNSSGFSQYLNMFSGYNQPCGNGYNHGHHYHHNSNMVQSMAYYAMNNFMRY